MDKEYYIVSDIKQNGIKNDNFKIIPINKIIFDKGMHILAKEKCDDICKNTGIKVLRNDSYIPMVRWDIVYNDFESNKPLDPIIVKEYSKVIFILFIQYYNGYKYIPCNILDT